MINKLHLKFGRAAAIAPEAIGTTPRNRSNPLGHLRIRLSPRPPKNEQEERGIHEEAVQFHAAALSIEQTSDGVKAFTGIITEVIAGDPYVLLIDEPEAFLHPAPSFNLGREIALASVGTRKRLFVSTHSPNFVMGCIQSGAPVSIVRLTYRNDVATARLLPSAEILSLMRNPLLSSTGVLGGLFYEFVVVTEGGAVWRDFLLSGFVPELEQNALATVRAAAMQKFTASGKDMKRNGGTAILNAQDREAVNKLFDRLQQYGLFTVRAGELESWLLNLGGSGHGPNWLIDIFEKMGEDPDSAKYLRPGDGDVWAFMSSIRTWLTNPNRSGIPA